MARHDPETALREKRKALGLGDGGDGHPDDPAPLIVGGEELLQGEDLRSVIARDEEGGPRNIDDSM